MSNPKKTNIPEIQSLNKAMTWISKIRLVMPCDSQGLNPG